MINNAATQSKGLDLTNALFKAPSPSGSQGSSNGFNQFMTDRVSRGNVTNERSNGQDQGRRNSERSDQGQGQGRSVESHRSNAEQRENRRPQRETSHIDAEQSQAEVDVNANVYDNTIIRESEEIQEVQEILAEALAEVVYIPAEVILDLLAELDMAAEELSHPKEASKFLQSLLKAETPVDLLTMPEYQDTLKKVVEAAEKVLLEAVKPESYEYMVSLARDYGVYPIDVEKIDRILADL